MIVTWLAGCHAERIAALEGRIAERRNEVHQLQEEIGELKQQLDKSPPRSASIRKDNDPPGFDLDRPLPKGKAGQPDVLLVSIDTLRADHLGTYGYARPTSPFLDSLAEGGAVFEQDWSAAPWTLPSHTTMLSGWLPIHHGTIEDHLSIDPRVGLLQEVFQKAGWGTIGVVSTLFVSSRYGFQRGFDHFTDFGILDKKENNLSTVDADQVFHNALYWAQQEPDGKPLFLFTHLYDCHFQYDPPAPWNTKFDRPPNWDDEVYKNYDAYKKKMIPKVQLDHQIAQYDEEIAFVDAQLEQFVDLWRGSGRDLIVVVTADHGEEFGERGSWGHGHTLYAEQLHVPLIINGPGIPVQRVADRMGTEDLAPTVAALAGLRFDTAKDGSSRAREVLGGPGPTPDRAGRFADTSRFDALVYRWHDEPFDLVVDLAEGKRELFDLSQDPEEKHNVYKANKDRAEHMFEDMSVWLGEPWQSAATGTIEVQHGVLFTNNGERQPDDVMQVKPGTRFAVQPGDAEVLFRPVGKTDTVGPWRPLGGSVPGRGCPVKFTGRYVEGTELDMSDDDREQLAALGYVTEEEDAPAAPSGPVPCR